MNTNICIDMFLYMTITPKSEKLIDMFPPTNSAKNAIDMFPFTDMANDIYSILSSHVETVALIEKK
ncbi:hypothetical protein RBH29_03705 [Herbivorax sp. ANBcel31]|uniref:hypothetical protein n=1 Tax=Herbivorax sp. ANBcel31 TaxID=3069754 RepID=UPI0027B664AD|nr:hypothetical protein [Herbivorax sp. ANBcel31]MDQ2085538.1 hypothetical protein [Herbivorax sp. ANBcel31]